MGQLDLPGAGETGGPDLGLQHKAMRAVGREVVRDDRERDVAATSLPGGEFFQCGTPGTQDTVRPLQVGPSDMTPVIGEEGYVISHGDGDLGAERTGIAFAGAPGH